MKGQALAYNKDNQEDKEPLFDSVDTVIDTLRIFADMVPHITFYETKLREATLKGFATATDLADYLVKKGMAFRDAHEAVANAVKYCSDRKVDLADLSITDLRKACLVSAEMMAEDVFSVLTLEGSVNSRNHTGGTAPAQVLATIAKVKASIVNS
jgi:argininosuccinate lyase